MTPPALPVLAAGRPVRPALLGTVLLAALLPARGAGAHLAGGASTGSDRAALLPVRRPAVHPRGDGRAAPLAAAPAPSWPAPSWLFPLLGLASPRTCAVPADARAATPGCSSCACVPSTIQSSIAFTSIARGNVPAAICAGSFSSLAGIVAHPAARRACCSAGSGAGLRRTRWSTSCCNSWCPSWPASCCAAGSAASSPATRGCSAWSTAARSCWSSTPRSARAWCGASGTRSRRCGCWRAAGRRGRAAGRDARAHLRTAAQRSVSAARTAITIVFAGSKKSLAAGLPMACVLFGGARRARVLPLMLFHQMQLMVCAVLAKRWARQAEEASTAVPAAARPREVVADRS